MKASPCLDRWSVRMLPGALVLLLLNSACLASWAQGSGEILPPVDPVSWVKTGSIWHYSNDGIDQGQAWRLPDFSVADWPSGPAQLGYGDGDEATVTREARPPHPMTSYFRTEFQVDRAGAFGQLLVRLVRDDGAVVYLNGKELLRDNMPVGEVLFDTPAAANAPDENAWRTFEADAGLLVDGRNVLAVEVHQANTASTDMSFDFELTGRPAGSLTPVISISAVDAEAREMAPMLPAFDNAVFRFERTGDAAGELVVFFSLAGTAEVGVDYQPLGNSVTLGAGQRAVELEVVVLDDLLAEGNESVVVTLESDPSMGPVERYRVNPLRAVAKAVIYDNDSVSPKAQVKIVTPQDGAQFAAGQVVRIVAWAVDPQGFIAQLEYFADGTKIGESSVGWPECVGCEPKPGDVAKHEFEWKGAAVGPHELVAKATRRIVFQPRYEEQILDPPAISAPVSVAVLEDSARPVFSIAATRAVAEESSFPYRRLPLTGEFTISRTGDLTQPASVFVHYGGRAENGVDCERLPLQVTVPSGEAAVSLEVKAIPDEIVERPEKLIAWLSACPPRTDPPLGVPCVGVEIDPERVWAVVTICDDARCGQEATLEITAPRDGAVFPVGAPITINALAIDPLGAITRVEFWADEQQIGVSEIWFFRAPDPGTPIHHEFVWNNAKPGAHTLFARAKDSAGLDVASFPVQIDVGEPLPLRVAIVEPSSGAVFAPDDTVQIRALALTAGAAVAKLEIHADGQLLGSTEAAELTVEWKQPPAGPHALSAHVVARDGQEATSRPVRILVCEPPALGFVQRDLPPAYSPGVAFEVKLVAAPSRLGNAWAVAEQPPAGWSLADISDDGVFDAAQGRVKFGPYTDLAGRTLTYKVTPPANVRGQFEFSGQAALDGHVAPVGGDQVISSSTQMHPADFDPEDFAIGLGEVTAYAAAWKQGAPWPAGPVPVPLNYVTRAGQIWRQGETYLYDPSRGAPPECWVPDAAGGDPGVRTVSPHRAERQLSGPVTPGAVLDVQIAIRPDPSAGAFAVVEQVPAGWTFLNADAGAFYDPARGQIRWGPFYSAEPVTVTYRIESPAFVASFASLSGHASFDGRDQPILGARSVLAEDASTAIRFRGISQDGGAIRLVVGGLPGQMCQIDSSIDLVNWVPHRLVFVLDDGRVEVNESEPPTRARFFRVRPVSNP